MLKEQVIWRRTSQRSSPCDNACPSYGVFKKPPKRLFCSILVENSVEIGKKDIFWVSSKCHNLGMRGRTDVIFGLFFSKLPALSAQSQRKFLSDFVYESQTTPAFQKIIRALVCGWYAECGGGGWKCSTFLESLIQDGQNDTKMCTLSSELRGKLEFPNRGRSCPNNYFADCTYFTYCSEHSDSPQVCT